MTVRVGLYVGSDWIAAVALRRNRLVWHADGERTGDLSLDAQLACLLQGAPSTRYPRPSVFVALGPMVAQVKQLRGLPPIDRPRVLRQLIQGSPNRFFLETPTAPAVAMPMRSLEGWWVSVADAETIATIESVCTRRGLNVCGVRPVAVLLDHALANPTIETGITWSDGPAILQMTYGDRGITSLHRGSAPGGRTPPLAADVAGPLAALGVGAWRFAGAFAAARAGSSAPLPLWRAGDGRRGPRQLARRVASISTLVIGAAVTLAAPGVTAVRSRAESDRAFEVLRTTASSVARERMALEQQQAALRQVRTFADTRRLITPMLSSLSIQLPESTAIIALRLDTLGGSLVTLSPVGAELVPAIGDTPGVDAIQLSAPITRETVGPVELQRIAVRFRFKRRAKAMPVRI